MDVLMFLHLWVYPVMFGGFAVISVLLFANAVTRMQVLFAFVMTMAALLIFVVSMNTHITYQGYCS